jgi:hypothetical protein
MQSLTDTILRQYYNSSRFGNNTPSNVDIFKTIAYYVELHKIARVNSNGIQRKADWIEKKLKQAK